MMTILTPPRKPPEVVVSNASPQIPCAWQLEQILVPKLSERHQLEGGGQSVADDHSAINGASSSFASASRRSYRSLFTRKR